MATAKYLFRFQNNPFLISTLVVINWKNSFALGGTALKPGAVYPKHPASRAPLDSPKKKEKVSSAEIVISL